MEDTYEIKATNSFNQRKNRNFSSRAKNCKSINLINNNSHVINNDSICYLNPVKVKLKKYRTLKEREKAKELEKNKSLMIKNKSLNSKKNYLI